MDVREYVLIARKRWLSIAVCAVLGGVLGLIYGLVGPSIYSAQTQEFIAISGTSDPASAFGGSSFTLQRVESYEKVVDSPATLEPVIKELGLQMGVPELAGMVTAANPKQTVLLTITVQGRSPQLVADIANSVAVHYANALEALETPAGGTSTLKVTQTTQASVPWEPMPRHLGLKSLAGLLLGLAAGIGQALLRERLDSSVRTPEEFATAAGASSLGWIAEVGDPLVALDQTSHRSEGFRTLRTNLDYVDVDNPPHVMTVTSGQPSEGKTTVACNLAIVLAQAGRRVCLVDADLRRPAVGRALGIETAVGLTDVLAGGAPLSSALLKWRRGLLTVLPAGSLPPNPSELLGSDAFGNVLHTLRRRFDVVILDSAPLLPVADGALVALSSDGALLVGRYGVTSAVAAEESAAALDRVGARLLGTVLNAVPTEGGAAGPARYEVGYGYGYGPEQDDRPTEVVVGNLDQMFR